MPSTAEELLDKNKLDQEHLNHRMFLHILKHLIDQVDLITILQEFILFFFSENARDSQICKFVFSVFFENARDSQICKFVFSVFF